MPVRAFEVNAAAAAPIVEPAVVEASRGAAEGEGLLLDAAEDRVEVGVAHMEGVMSRLEGGVRVEEKGQRVIHFNGREMTLRAVIMQAENLREPARRRFLSRAGTIVWLRTMAIA